MVGGQLNFLSFLRGRLNVWRWMLCSDPSEAGERVQGGSDGSGMPAAVVVESQPNPWRPS